MEGSPGIRNQRWARSENISKRTAQKEQSWGPEHQEATRQKGFGKWDSNLHLHQPFLISASSKSTITALWRVRKWISRLYLIFLKGLEGRKTSHPDGSFARRWLPSSLLHDAREIDVSFADLPLKEKREAGNAFKWWDLIPNSCNSSSLLTKP